MCLLVKVAPDTVFPADWFEDCFRKNPDGLGIAYVKDGTIIVEKTLPADAAAARLWWLEHAPRGVEYALHWRMRTHGAVDLERVHPYAIHDGKLYLMHNGVLSIGGDTTKESDTQIYARTYGVAVAPVVHEPLVRQMIGEHIGRQNRFIFIHAEHGLLLVNESAGVTTDMFPGCWFSNTYAWTPHLWGVYGSGRMSFHDWSDEPGFPSWTPPKKNVVTDVDAVGDSFRAHTELAAKLVELFDLVEDYSRHGDASARRFLQVYATEEELLDILPVLHLSADEALVELTATIEYLEAGMCDFDDLLEWYTLSADNAQDPLDGADEETGSAEVQELRNIMKAH
jgi:hypothetical protein